MIRTDVVYVDQFGRLTQAGWQVLTGLQGSGGGVSDGDKGDITVSGGAAVWTIDAPVAASFRDRATHTGTQLAATISNLATTVQAYTLDTFANPVAAMDFAQQQSLQFVIENRTSDPGSPATGQIWLRTDL